MKVVAIIPIKKNLKELEVKTLEKLKQSISDEKKELDIQDANQEEKFDKNNFINLKNNLEEGI